MQGALIGGIVSVSFVAWISLGTQAAISTGQIHFLTKPISVEECPAKFHAFSLRNSTLILENATREAPFFLYRMSYLWYTWVGFLVAILVGLFVSWITGPNKYRVEDKKLYTPVIHGLLKGASTPMNITELEKVEHTEKTS